MNGGNMRTTMRVIGLAVVVSALAAAQPAAIPIQGTLTSSAGVPLNGMQSLKLAIYSAATGGTPLYEETQTVTVTNGLFTAQLGSAGTLNLAAFTGQDLFLGVTVGADPEMTPRLPFGTVPYAAYAPRAGNAASATTALNATNAMNSANATNATNAVQAQNANNAVNATNADFATSAASVAFTGVNGFPANCSGNQFLKGYAGGAASCATPIDTDTGVNAVSSGTGIAATITGRTISIGVGSAVQLRSVTPTCPVGTALRDLAANGTPTCTPTIPTSLNCFTVSGDSGQPHVHGDVHLRDRDRWRLHDELQQFLHFRELPRG